MKVHVLTIPMWALLLISALISAAAFRARRRLHLRSRAGHCLKCGYDLRESKDKCPECGSVIAPATL
jgi:predicted Zn-ribbon and HTH transcriptional regulator